MANERIFVDLEYCYPGMTRESGRPSEDKLRQVVQIAAIKSDGNGTELASFDVLVHPAYEKRLPDFFVVLTGITQADVDERGIPFPEAFEGFKKFCRDTPIWTFHKDWSVLKQNCGYFNIPFDLPEFTKVRDLLQGWNIDPAKYSSGTLYKAAGLEMHGHVHNALHDVRSMAAAVYYFETVSAPTAK